MLVFRTACWLFVFYLLVELRLYFILRRLSVPLPEAPPHLEAVDLDHLDALIYRSAKVMRLLRLPSSCLTQALTIQRVLSAYGYSLRLCVGVQKRANFRAHAWLTLDDDIIFGDRADIKEFTPMAAFDDASLWRRDGVLA